MQIDVESTAADLMEMASEQRLSIILMLNEQKLSMSKIAKALEATPPEVHRNINRLSKAGYVKKDTEGDYSLTVLGKIICDLLPSFTFIAKNKDFFANHNFDDLESKFIQRIGALESGKKIRGFVKVLEKWKDIHANSEKYIYNLLAEVPYSNDIIDIVDEKLSKGVHIKSIFSESTIVPEERKKVFKQKNFDKYIQNGSLDRKMRKSIQIVVVLNEKEGGIIFPSNTGDPDMSEMFYSSDPKFHDWCHDYFNWMWTNSGSFREDKLAQ